MSNTEIKVGDLVWLTSNRYRQMNVEKIEDGLATCIWTDKKDDHRQTYSLNLLEKVQPLGPGLFG